MTDALTKGLCGGKGAPAAPAKKVKQPKGPTQPTGQQHTPKQPKVTKGAGTKKATGTITSPGRLQVICPGDLYVWQGVHLVARTDKEPESAERHKGWR